MTSSRDPQLKGPGTTAARRAVHAGQVIAERYLVEHELGRGGMGVVYRAQHTLTARPVALKLLRERAGSDQCALNEARSAASLRHPNVVEVLDLDLHDGVPFLVMELLNGAVLSADTAGARDVAQLLRWLLPILGAVAALHDRGYVHGDLKPASVLLHQQGPQIVPKLIDFGLASALFDRGLLRAPLYGTPRYMAPERAAGADLTVQADVWSLGLTLLECLAGDAATPGSLTAHRPDLPLPFVLAIERALQPELQLRHATVRALARNLVEACCLVGIVLPDDLDPVGLPELASWRREAAQRPLSETHTVEAEQPSPRQRGTSAPRWPWRSVLAVGALAVGLCWTLLASVAPTSPRASRVGSGAEIPISRLGSHEEPRAANLPTLPGAPAAEEPARQQQPKETTAVAPRSTPAAKRVRSVKLAPEYESEEDDITAEWR